MEKKLERILKSAFFGLFLSCNVVSANDLPLGEIVFDKNNRHPINIITQEGYISRNEKTEKAILYVDIDKDGKVDGYVLGEFVNGEFLRFPWFLQVNNTYDDGKQPIIHLYHFF